MTHDHGKQIEALAELIVRDSTAHGTPLTMEQAAIAAKSIRSRFDLAGKGTLLAFKEWVLAQQAAGPYMDIGGDDTQAQNCAAEICC